MYMSITGERGEWEQNVSFWENFAYLLNAWSYCKFLCFVHCQGDQPINKTVNTAPYTRQDLEWIRHWFGTSWFILVIYLKIKDTLHRVQRKIISKMSVYSKDFVPYPETVGLGSNLWALWQKRQPWKISKEGLFLLVSIVKITC